MSPAVFRLFAVLLIVFAARASARCRKVLLAGLSEEDKTIIIKAHNQYRNSVAMGEVAGQPPAANMSELVWDEKAAKLGQTVSDTCVFEHVKVSEGDGVAIGQNLYWGGNTKDNVDREAALVAAVNAWFDENKTYRFGTSVYNYYTQLVWADTVRVGCGYTKYSNRREWIEYLVVCNYYPAGNYIGQVPYVIGTRDCSKYNLENSTEYSGLCAK